VVVVRSALAPAGVAVEVVGAWVVLVVLVVLTRTVVGGAVMEPVELDGGGR
jgi:hypothetical protein